MRLFCIFSNTAIGGSSKNPQQFLFFVSPSYYSALEVQSDLILWVDKSSPAFFAHINHSVRCRESSSATLVTLLWPRFSKLSQSCCCCFPILLLGQKREERGFLSYAVVRTSITDTLNTVLQSFLLKLKLFRCPLLLDDFDGGHFQLSPFALDNLIPQSPSLGFDDPFVLRRR